MKRLALLFRDSEGRVALYPFFLPLFACWWPLWAAATPRGMAGLLDGFGLFCAIDLILHHRRIVWPAAARDLFWVAAALAFVALSSWWSVSPRALEMLRDTSLVTLAAMLAFTASHLWPPALVRLALRLFLVGCALGFVYFAITTALHFPLQRLLAHAKDTLDYNTTNLPKRTAALFALLMWPAALWTKTWVKTAAPRRARARLHLGCLVAAVALLACLPSRAAMLGSGVGLALFLLSSLRVKGKPAGLWLAQAAGLVMLPLALPLMLLVALSLPQVPPRWEKLLPTSGEYRLAIWNYAGNQAVAHLPLGIGIDGSRTLATPGDKIAEPIGDADSALLDNQHNNPLPDHPHNVFLQIWLEAGLAGAALCCFLGWQLWRRLRRTAPALQPCLWGYVGAAFVTLGVAYGTWQAWWLAGHAGTALLLTLIVRQAAAKEARSADASACPAGE